MCTKLVIISLCILPKISSSKSDIDSDVLQRSRRQLLFPNSTLFQFNAGVGTPTPIATINFNWAFQANFQLPWNRSQIPLDILEAESGYPGFSRRKRDVYDVKSDHDTMTENYQNDAKLYHFYKYVEDVLNGFGYNGSSCVLRTLCQLAAEPLHVDDEEDLLHEIATFVFNPENDINDDGTIIPEATPYIDAYKSGSSIGQCNDKYNDCKISLIDMFTQLNDIENYFVFIFTLQTAKN
ncbi:uncharacterized protein LOC106711361 [Papilio machaon]|uniref:uncharacterized protein LOC106711361 n=1 Tax=Papilio machaon TaxID=76193 RepID=UPI001E664343|nr:uncharacterized protein LOC106711361 [Papilio machaon]